MQCLSSSNPLKYVKGSHKLWPGTGREMMTKKSICVGLFGWKGLVAVTSWYVWWERRQATHGEQIQTHVRSTQLILALCLNYIRSKKSKHGISRPKWKKPPEDYVMLNVDATFSSVDERGVRRDDQGNFVAAKNCCNSCGGSSYD